MTNYLKSYVRELEESDNTTTQESIPWEEGYDLDISTQIDVPNSVISQGREAVELYVAELLQKAALSIPGKIEFGICISDNDYTVDYE